ncbi:ATP-binding protein [Rhodobacteraceae bacterium DSL-40]|uniref:hybrid sensor histidine kinase/response regulator n=1 Tax=Amaricoccus sp. B4 TaxID=3368557 RepID=UPI000DADD2F4
MSIGGAAHRISSYAPAAAAISLILAFGTVADRTTSELALQTERDAVEHHLDTLRLRLEQMLDTQFEALVRLAGVAATDPGLFDGSLEDITAAIASDPAPIMGLALLPGGGDKLVAAGKMPSNETLLTLLRQGNPDENGARSLPGAVTPALLLWAPVRLAAPNAGDQLWGQAIAAIDAGMLFARAGLRDSGALFDVALTEGDRQTQAGPGLRALLVGSPEVLGADPVISPVHVPGGDWMLAAHPVNGWNPSSTALWSIRGFTIASAIGFGLLLIRMRNLTEQRRRNVAALRRNDQALSLATRRLTVAVEASRLGVWEYNATTGKVEWDARMRELYDIPEDQAELRYIDWLDRVHPEDRLAADAAVRTALSCGTPLSTTFRICDRHRVKYIEATSNCAREADGMLIIIGVNRDITATVERNGELERRQVQLERAAANRSRFFATMSHEIRTPLNGVMGVLDLMLHDTLSAAQRKRAQIVHSSARQLLNIVNDCLDLSKLHATQLAIHPTETDVRDLAREVVSLMSASIRGGAVTLTASFTPGIPGAVICDPMRLRQVLTNLVGNALKYTDEGSVKLSLDHVPEGGGMLAVEVSDTGIGIPAVALDTLFQRFTQADADEARRRGGTGLGLAICKEIIVAMGGEIGVESREGKGSVFRFRIPAPAAQPQGSQWPDPEPLALCEEDSVAAEPPLPRGAARIILTAQPGDARRILASYLCLGGNEVTFATHGSEVIEGVLGGRLDLVLLDLDMPGLDAASVTRRVRRIAAPMGSVPVLGIADLPFGDKAAACRAADMTAILGKPVTAESLYGAIERALAPPALGPLAAAPLHHDIGRLENSA